MEKKKAVRDLIIFIIVINIMLFWGDADLKAGYRINNKREQKRAANSETQEKISNIYNVYDNGENLEDSEDAENSEADTDLNAEGNADISSDENDIAGDESTEGDNSTGGDNSTEGVNSSANQDNSESEDYSKYNTNDSNYIIDRDSAYVVDPDVFFNIEQIFHDQTGEINSMDDLLKYAGITESQNFDITTDEDENSKYRQRTVVADALFQDMEGFYVINYQEDVDYYMPVSVDIHWIPYNNMTVNEMYNALGSLVVSRAGNDTENRYLTLNLENGSVCIGYDASNMVVDVVFAKYVG